MLVFLHSYPEELTDRCACSGIGCTALTGDYVDGEPSLKADPTGNC